MSHEAEHCGWRKHQLWLTRRIWAHGHMVAQLFALRLNALYPRTKAAGFYGDFYKKFLAVLTHGGINSEAAIGFLTQAFRGELIVLHQLMLHLANVGITGE